MSRQFNAWLGTYIVVLNDHIVVEINKCVLYYSVRVNQIVYLYVQKQYHKSDMCVNV